MRTIWYLLRCPVGNEWDFVRKFRELAEPGQLEEVIRFEYQRLMRYRGGWHVERRTLLPGCVFLSVAKLDVPKDPWREKDRAEGTFSLIPCEIPYVKGMCREENVVGMSKGVIRNGRPVITSGPLKGREGLIREIDRHKRIADIEIPLAGERRQVTVGLEIYEKL